jgi:hypothetical protein
MIATSRQFLCVLAAALLVSTPLSAQDGPVPELEAYEAPVMISCMRDASFDAFIKTVRSVIKRRNTNDLLALAADDIQNRFPFELGKSEMMLNWYLRDQGKKSYVWPTLRNILKRPCKQDEAGRRWMDDGDPDGYFLLMEKREDVWMINALSGNPD